jgi:hypothetical protein
MQAHVSIETVEQTGVCGVIDIGGDIWSQPIIT